jgi:hypothetical protein
VTVAPEATGADGVPVQCVPGLSGGELDRHAAALTGHTVVHLHGGLTPASEDGWAENLFAPGQRALFNYPLDQTGRLVHKTDPEVMEAFPPFTVVNGKVWPVLDVQPATYRFRVLNGSNARTYRLVLLREGAPELARITQIGTDHGVLRAPVHVPADGLVLASAERADMLVDFSDLAPGSELTVLNTAAAPFDGSSFPAADAEKAADLEDLLPYPQVLRFRVVDEAPTRVSIPRELATDYEPPAADALAGAPRRAIALVERELDGEPNMLTEHEDRDMMRPFVTMAPELMPFMARG